MDEQTTTPEETTKTSFWKKPIVRKTLLVTSAVAGVTLATMFVGKKVADAVPFEDDVEVISNEDGSLTIRETTTIEPND